MASSSESEVNSDGGNSCCDCSKSDDELKQSNLDGNRSETRKLDEKTASNSIIFERNAKQSLYAYLSSDEGDRYSNSEHSRSNLALPTAKEHGNEQLDVDVETGVASRKYKSSAKLKTDGKDTIGNESNDHNNTNSDEARSVRSFSSSSHLDTKQQETMLRMTPGAFAINNPLSSTSSRDRPLLEQRSSIIAGGTTFTSTVMNEASRNTSSLEEEMDNISILSNSSVVESSQQLNNSDGATPQEPTTAVVELASTTPCLSAIRIGHEFEVYDGKIVGQEDETNGKPEQGTKQKARFLTGVLVFLLLGVGAAIVVVLATRNQRLGGTIDDPTSYDGTSNSETPGVVHLPSGVAIGNSPETHREEINDYLVSVLGPISGPAGGAVFDRASKSTSLDRISALNWMTDDLAAVFHSSSLSHVQDAMPEWKIIQRYVLALLYFTTNGGSWDVQANFLSREDECTWIAPTPSDWKSRDVILERINENIGVSCNEDGRIHGLHLQWNDLSGTIPAELCNFKDIEVLELSGGSISGLIPSTLAQMSKLKTLALNDNCFSGAIPEDLSSGLPLLERFSIINNGDLYGSLNDFCSNNEYAREQTLAVATECPVPFSVGDDDIERETDADLYGGVECDCCICCDRNDYDCYDQQSGHSWKSHNLNAKLMHVLDAKSFDRKKECRTSANKKWIREKCPCAVTISKNNTDGLISYECTDDCNQEGAHTTFLDWYWY